MAGLDESAIRFMLKAMITPPISMTNGRNEIVLLYSSLEAVQKFPLAGLAWQTGSGFQSITVKRGDTNKTAPTTKNIVKDLRDGLVESLLGKFDEPFVL